MEQKDRMHGTNVNPLRPKKSTLKSPEIPRFKCFPLRIISPQKHPLDNPLKLIPFQRHYNVGFYYICRPFKHEENILWPVKIAQRILCFLPLSFH